MNETATTPLSEEALRQHLNGLKKRFTDYLPKENHYEVEKKIEEIWVFRLHSEFFLVEGRLEMEYPIGTLTPVEEEHLGEVAAFLQELDTRMKEDALDSPRSNQEEGV